jgi:hypothetical protein
VSALAALAWNPLVLFEIAGNAHNDVLMVTFCLLGLLLLERSERGVSSTLAFSLGALVKYLSGIGLVWLAFASAARARTWPVRIGRIAALAALSLACALLFSAPWLELPDSLDPLLTETAGVGYVNSLPHALLGWLLGDLERPLVLGAFGVYLLWETRCVWSEPTRTAVARALARSSLVYILVVSMSVQPWYFCLPVSIAITLGVRHPLARVSLGYAALALPALYLSYYLREQTPGVVFVVYAFLPLALLLPEALATRTRARAHVPAAIRVRHDEQRPRGHAVASAVVEERGR